MNESEVRYEKLKERINEIISNFSFEQDPVEPPTKKQEDFIRAMIVLCHAEFEEYIENLANELITCGENKWDSERIANKNLAALFLNSDKMKNDEKMPDMSMYTYSKKMITNYRNWIRNENHGIKIKNIKNMYTPLGYSLDDFAQDFLNELDAFGMERGKVAHSSFSQTRSMLDLKTEKDKILNILNEIIEFERILLA